MGPGLARRVAALDRAEREIEEQELQPVAVGEVHEPVEVVLELRRRQPPRTQLARAAGSPARVDGEPHELPSVRA
jgi:hypothetical protein